MPNTSSAKKALRVSGRRRTINLGRKKVLKDVLKSFKRAIKEGDRDKSIESLNFLYKTADKIAKTGYIKPNKASRIKSRATKLFDKTFTSKQTTEKNTPIESESGA